MKKIFAAVMACVMLLCILPANIFAQGIVFSSEPQGVWIAGIRVDDESETTYFVNDGEGGITSEGASADNYNVMASTNSANVYVTLKDASLSNDIKCDGGKYISSYVIYAHKDLYVTYTIEGTNTVVSKDVFTKDDTHTSYASYGMFNVSAIKGNGSLNVDVDANRMNDKCRTVVYGVYGKSSETLAIKGNVKLKITADLIGENEDSSSFNVWGVYGRYLNIFENATVSVESGRSDESGEGSVYGIYATTNVYDKATVNVKSEYACGNGITIESGTVELIGTKGVGNSVKLGKNKEVERTIKVNTEPTAEGAKKDNKAEKFEDYKYLHIKHYYDTEAKFIKALKIIGDILKAFISMPLKFYDMMKIVFDNFVDMIKAYMEDFGLIRIK